MKKILLPLLIISFNSFAYNRKADYGDWQDYDNDCQNTRAEILISQSLYPVKFTQNNNCYVESGKWIDYYTGKVYTDAKDVQIDHLISLHQHYNAVGSKLTYKERVKYANEQKHLVITNSKLNMLKSDKNLSDFISKVPLQNKCKYIKDYQRIANENNVSLDESDMKIINNNEDCNK